MDNPEGHDAPVQDNEDAKVELEHRGKQGKGDDPCRNREKVPAELDDDSQVADRLLVIPRLSQGLLVGGQGPGQRDKGGCCCHTCNSTTSWEHYVNAHDILENMLICNQTHSQMMNLGLISMRLLHRLVQNMFSLANTNTASRGKLLAKNTVEETQGNRM